MRACSTAGARRRAAATGDGRRGRERRRRRRAGSGCSRRAAATRKRRRKKKKKRRKGGKPGRQKDRNGAAADKGLRFSPGTPIVAIPILPPEAEGLSEDQYEIVGKRVCDKLAAVQNQTT